MIYSLVFLAGLAPLAIASSCNADNCLRVVAGTINGQATLSSRLADCSNWMTATVTPATSTVTVTASTSATTYLPPVRHRHKHKRMIANVPVTPTYVLASCTANPTPVAVRWSSACSCAGITHGTTTLPTPVVTTTVTTTSTIDLPLCTNYGLEYAAYPFTNVYNYDPTQYKPLTPETSGVTTNISFSNYADWTDPASLYGSTPIDTTKVAVTYRGYLVAPQTGTYTFSSTLVDDYLSIWLGPTAYAGWNFQNAGITADSPPVYYYYGASGPGFTLADNFQFTYSVDLIKGLNPLRFLWVNGGGPGAFKITITAPDGTVLVDPSIANSNYLLTDCAIYGAPAYPAYGSET